MRRVLVPLLTSFLTATIAVAATRPARPTIPPPQLPDTTDVHSYSDPRSVRVEHLSLDLSVDFDRRVLAGSATLRLHNPGGATRLVLDTRDLTIGSVTLDGSNTTTYTIGSRHPILGSPLTIDIQPATRFVRITYTTSPAASALTWLTPAQTTDRLAPFLYTQNEPIDARSWIPLQDTPATRVTFDATVRVPAGMLALMSAENPMSDSADGVYRFGMPDPIAPYLIALTVGELEFAPIASNLGVYAEPSRLAAAAAELATLPAMMATAERDFGPYRWQRYDLAVMPHTYQVGGMEHARLTFVHPYFISGDGSLTALIAHELAHSWAGNLVTLSTWNDVWLNEGVTSYMEHRIMESVYGREFEEILAENAMNGLRNAVRFAPQIGLDTRMHRPLAPADHPIAGFDVISYDKGWAFMRMLEEQLGRGTIDSFLTRYFRRNAWSNMSARRFTDEFTSFAQLSSDTQSGLGLDTWIFGTGLPDNASIISSSRLRAVENEAERFLAGASAASLDAGSWSGLEIAHLLRIVPSNRIVTRMAELNERFALNDSTHRSVRAAWLTHVVRNNWSTGFASLDAYLTLNPSQSLYRELMNTSAGRERAVSIYSRARERYHPNDQRAIDSLFASMSSTTQRFSESIDQYPAAWPSFLDSDAPTHIPCSLRMMPW